MQAIRLAANGASAGGDGGGGGVSRFGIAARGVVFVMVGWFLVRAAMQASAAEVGGIAEALRVLEQHSTGPWVLGTVALGLIGYGLYQLLNARYRRITV